MQEPIGASETLHQFGSDGFPQLGVEVVGGHSKHERKRRYLRAVTEAGERCNALSAPEGGPACRTGPPRCRCNAWRGCHRDPTTSAHGMIEGQQAFVAERGQELRGEEGIARRLVADELREGGDTLGSECSASAISATSCRARGASAISCTTAPASRIASSCRARGWSGHFVIPKGADDEHVADVGPRQQVPEEIDRGPCRATASRRRKARADAPAARTPA